MNASGLDRRQILTALCALGVFSAPLAHAAALATACPLLAEGVDPAVLRELATAVASGSRAVGGDAISALQRDLSAPDALARINRRTIEDFERDRIVQLGEWRVSQTEAALYVALSRCA